MSNSEEERSQNDTAPTGTDKALKSSPATPQKSKRKEKEKQSPVKEEFAWRATPPQNDSPKKQGLIPKSKEQKQDDEVSSGSTCDICRICHMGGFPPLTETRPMWEWQNQGVHRVSSQISTLSSYAYLGPLISACKCRGTVGLVHAECLERWLTESGHTRCELCGHKYVTKRVPRHSILRSIAIWFKTVVATRQMLLDVLYLVVTTPLALFSCYVCALALRMILESGFYEIPWMIVAMLPTCSLTLIAYWGWLITLGRYTGRLHSRRWRRFWRNNFVVKLLPDNALARLNDTSDNNYAPPSAPIIVLDNDNPQQEVQTMHMQNDEPEEFIRIL